MEMCITNQYLFPPPALVAPGSEQVEELKAKEVQITAMERQSILDFEIQLAAATNKATITEATSLLLAQLINMDPMGPFRKPPQQFLDQLQQSNQHFRLGHLLCRSRQPDFLLDILQRQETNQAMPWLSDLVESSDGSFNVLPVQCLCEVLLNSGEESEEADEGKKRKQKQLLRHLQGLLQDSNDEAECTETLEYFLQRLGSHQTHQRLRALRGLRLVLSSPNEKDDKKSDDDDIEIMMMEVEGTRIDSSNEWLLQKLPALPCFSRFYPQISHFLRVACQVENDPNAVSLYIQFLAHYAPESLGDLADLCLDMSSIVERSTLLPAVLPGPLCKISPRAAADTFNSLLRLFINYMNRLKSAGKQGITWEHVSDKELITIEWPDGFRMTQTEHFQLIVQAQIILLTFGPSAAKDAKTIENFNQLLAMWYPVPIAYHADGSGPFALIQSWLKLRMVRSDVEVLVDSALQKLEPKELVLFIQSFGIPTASMTKLLQALDHIVTVDLKGVKEAVMDEKYMGKLVSVQHQRGARGGERFASALKITIAPPSSHSMSEVDRFRPELQPPVIPPRSTAMIPPGHVKATLLHLFDVGSPSRMTMKEKQDTFRTLQKYLTSEIRSDGPSKPMLDATIKALDQILKSSELKSSFVTALLQRTPFSCGLFRLVSTAMLRHKESPSSGLLLKVCNTLFSEIKIRESKGKTIVGPLKGLVEDFILKKGFTPGSRTSSPSKRGSPVPSSPRKNDEEDFEESLHLQIEQALKRKQTKPLVESMSKMLLNEDEEGDKKSTTTKSGLLMDWLHLLDPELIQASPDVKQKLLFAKGGKSRKVRPHLMLTMLAHQASWPSLKGLIDDVLGSFDTNFDPSAVLDFLETCVYLQKQWQCRDKHVPKHDNMPVDVLALSKHQVEVMLDYALDELAETCSTREEMSKVVQSRIGLIVGCLATKSSSRDAVDYLCTKLLNTDSEDLIRASPKKGAHKSCSKTEVVTDDKAFEKDHLAVKELILHVYMKIPHCLIHLVKENRAVTGNNFMNQILPKSLSDGLQTSVVDVVSHTLISSLAATQAGRAWGLQMQEFECSIRKLASTHPLLVLRNLPLIAASLHGRTHFEFTFFRSRNHMTFYVMMLGVMDLLSPFIFRPEYKKSFQDALNCYFEMLRSYFVKKDSMAGLIDKFIGFLLIYLDHQPSEATKFIKTKGGPLLTDLKEALHQLPSLNRICGMISFDDKHDEDVVAPSGLSNTDIEKKNLIQDSDRFIGSLSFDKADEDLITVLSDLKHVSNPKPAVLTFLSDELSALLLHSSRQVRSLTYELILKLLRYSPKSNSVIVPFYIDSLESPDPGVAVSAIEKLPDICPLAQEELTTILKTAFNLGLYSNLAVTSYISDAIAVLNSQAGY